MKPLRELTHKGVEWCWGEAQEKAWSDVKNLVASAPVLAYYKANEVVEIQCDSSQCGLGAVLMQNGQPIAYASRALTETESRYAQIDWRLFSQLRSLTTTRLVEELSSTVTTDL